MVPSDATPSDRASEAALARPGVCVTGEARAFVYPGVRANLATLLRSIRAAALYMTIARHASCDGGTLSRDAALCASTRGAVFELDEADLAAQFQQAGVLTLLNVSSCATERNQHEMCCHFSNARRARPTPAFLQYLELRRCADWMLQPQRARILTHIVRTRPDLIYLHPHRLDVGRYTQPTFTRKAEPYSFMASHRSTELFAPGDWFIIVPLGVARALFTFLYETIDRQCRRGSLALAAESAPESQLLTDLARVLGETSHDCGAVDAPYVDSLGLRDPAEARGWLAKLDRLGAPGRLEWGRPWARCIDSFHALGVVRVFANGAPDCSRSSNTSACESAARRIIGKLR